MDSVRHLVAAERAARVALGQFERTVEVWDLRPVRRIAKFETVLDFGGRRLVLSDGGDVLVAAAYHRFGVAAYAADTGMLLWHRRDIKRAQCLSVSHSSSVVYVGVERGPCLALSLDDGTQARQLRGVRAVVESPYDSLVLLDQTRPIVAVGSELECLFPVERTTFAFLATAFSPTHITISEAGGSVRCIALDTGHVAWTYAPPNGVHCLQLAYSEDLIAFVGVLWSFVKGGEKELVVFDGAGGLHNIIRRIKGSAEECFCDGNSGLLTSDRTLINLASNHDSALENGTQDVPG